MCEECGFPTEKCEELWGKLYQFLKKNLYTNHTIKRMKVKRVYPRQNHTIKKKRYITTFDHKNRKICEVIWYIDSGDVGMYFPQGGEDATESYFITDLADWSHIHS